MARGDLAAAGADPRRRSGRSRTSPRCSATATGRESRSRRTARRRWRRSCSRPSSRRGHGESPPRRPPRWRSCAASGSSRIVLANELVDRSGAALARRRARTAIRRSISSASSTTPSTARRMDAILAERALPPTARRARGGGPRGRPRRVPGRADAAYEVAEAVHAARHLAARRHRGVRGHLRVCRPTRKGWAGSTICWSRFAESLIRIARAGLFERDEVIVTAGGSMYFDRVIAGFGDCPRWAGRCASSCAAAATCRTTTAPTSACPRLAHVAQPGREPQASQRADPVGDGALAPRAGAGDPRRRTARCTCRPGPAGGARVLPRRARDRRARRRGDLPRHGPASVRPRRLGCRRARRETSSRLICRIRARRLTSSASSRWSTSASTFVTVFSPSSERSGCHDRAAWSASVGRSHEPTGEDRPIRPRHRQIARIR